jgi:outer membrane receptor protein involved in Fe transport
LSALNWNLGAHYQPTTKATVGMSVRHIGPRSSADGIWLVNLDGQWRLGPVQLFATLENILDDDVMHPNMAEFNDRLVPSGQGRNLKLGARYSF